MRILFTCYPGVGHLHPMLPLAGAAQRAAHDVVLATGPDLVPRAESYGFDVWPIGLSSDDTVARYLERYPHSNDLPAEERLRLVAPRMFVDIGALSRVEPLYERAAAWQPDLVVHDQSEFAAPAPSSTSTPKRAAAPARRSCCGPKNSTRRPSAER